MKPNLRARDTLCIRTDREAGARTLCRANRPRRAICKMETEDLRKSRDRESFTVTTVVNDPPSPLSAARVAAASSEKHARKMRFRIAKLSINRSWVNCDQPRFWFHIPTKTRFEIGFPREAPMVDLGCPCLVRLSRPRFARKVAHARKRVQRRRPRVPGIFFLAGAGGNKTPHKGI
jgi:hypothetical protein